MALCKVVTFCINAVNLLPSVCLGFDISIVEGATVEYCNFSLEINKVFAQTEISHTQNHINVFCKQTIFHNRECCGPVSGSEGLKAFSYHRVKKNKVHSIQYDSKCNKCLFSHTCRSMCEFILYD